MGVKGIIIVRLLLFLLIVYDKIVGRKVVKYNEKIEKNYDIVSYIFFYS